MTFWCRPAISSVILCLPAWGMLAYAALQVWLPLWLAGALALVNLVLVWLACQAMLKPVKAVNAFLQQQGCEVKSSPAEALAHWHAQQQRRFQELHDRFTARERVLDKHPDALVTLDDQLRVIRGNAAAERLLGKNLAGRPVASVLPVERALSVIQQAFEVKKDFAVEFSLNAPPERHFHMLVEPIAPEPLSRTRYAIILHDVTAIKRVQRANADFVANASHELRTPLTAIIGFIETLQGAARHDADARDNFLTIMHTEATRMKRMVNDLLSLSSIERRIDTPPEQTINALPVLEQVMQMLSLKAKEKQMTLSLVQAEPAAFLLGDADELGQVFQNILENAIKYGWQGGNIEVAVTSLVTPPAGVAMAAVPVHVFAFRNEGDGIAADEIPRLTERFYRTKAALGNGDGGTGLGLAIVKNILNRHGGALQITSELGRWSCFTVYLPAQNEN